MQTTYWSFKASLSSSWKCLHSCWTIAKLFLVVSLNLSSWKWKAIIIASVWSKTGPSGRVSLLSIFSVYRSHPNSNYYVLFIKQNFNYSVIGKWFIYLILFRDLGIRRQNLSFILKISILDPYLEPEKLFSASLVKEGSFVGLISLLRVTQLISFAVDDCGCLYLHLCLFLSSRFRVSSLP